jgi:type II secretory pathway pseudopilin PulG
MKEPVSTRRIRPSERGYVMLIAIFLMALLVISLAIAAPQVAKSIQRDRDLETYHRGLQYRRAIQLYYRKFHAYPPNVNALVETNNIRFLRKKYVDPITGKVDWKPVLFGQNKTPVPPWAFSASRSPAEPRRLPALAPAAATALTAAAVGPSFRAGWAS